MEHSIIIEKPVFEREIRSGTESRIVSVGAVQLASCQVGDILVKQGISSRMHYGENIRISVAHRTKSTIVLLVETFGWTENYNQVEKQRNTELIAIQLL